jgi:4-amino-4-deoxy-L-arabinose transferase-like glycosyltransferase
MKTPLILLFIALAIRLAAIFFWRFDGLYGQDSFAYIQQGLAIANNLPQGRPPPSDFFWPNGYPFLIAFFTLFVGQTTLAGQLAALLCGALLSPLAYWLIKDLVSNSYAHGTQLHQVEAYQAGARRAGILAGLIIAVAGQPILSSIVVMADMPALFWATLSAWCVVRASEFKQGGGGAGVQGCRGARVQPGNLSPAPTNEVRQPCSSALYYFLAAGAALALAIVTRWLYVLMVPALGLYTLYKLQQNKTTWWTPFPAILSGTAILIPQLLFSLNKPGGLLHSWLLGWRPINFFLRRFENVDGHFTYQLPTGIFYAHPAGHPAYIFPLLGLAALWGLWRFWQVRQWGPLILLLGWATPVYLFLGGIPYQNFRFGLSLYLPLVILTGFGLNDLLVNGLGDIKPLQNTLKGTNQESVPEYTLGLRYGPRNTQNNPEPTSPLLPGTPAPLLFSLPTIAKVLIALSLLGTLGWAYPMLNSFLTTQNHSKSIAHQVEKALPVEATLLTFGLTLTIQHYTHLNTLELFYLDESALDMLTQTRHPIYLLLDPHNIETQWLGKTPHLNYNWLGENTVLTEIDTFPPYVLFNVDRSLSRGAGVQGSRGAGMKIHPCPPAPLPPRTPAPLLPYSAYENRTHHPRLQCPRRRLGHPGLT